MAWLAKLLERPEKLFSSIDLYCDGDPEHKLKAASSLRRSLKMTSEEFGVLRRLREELQDVEERLAEGGGSELLQRKYDFLSKEIGEIESGRSEGNTITDSITRLHNNVRAQLRSLQLDLAEKMPRFSRHLLASIKLSNKGHRYIPVTPTSWNFEK